MKYKYETVSVRCANHVALAEIKTGNGLNVFSADVRADLADFLTKADADDRIRAVILTGAGKNFCIGEIQTNESAAQKTKWGKSRAEYADCVRIIRSMTKPVIAAVNGYAIGDGMNLALACDIVVAAKNAAFCEGETYDHRTPGKGRIYFLHQNLQESMLAKKLRMTIQRISADDAAQMGLVDRIVPRDNLLAEATALAKSIALGQTVSIACFKRLQSRPVSMNLDAAFAEQPFKA